MPLWWILAEMLCIDSGQVRALVFLICMFGGKLFIAAELLAPERKAALMEPEEIANV
jgi:hypothetical protein